MKLIAIDKKRLLDINKSLSHTICDCKYHVVFAPKYRRKVFYGNKRLEIGRILRQLCEFKKIQEYIQNQLKEDEERTQLSIDFQGDPFTGSK